MAWPTDLSRTKDWGTEILTDSDLEGQFDLIINWVMAAMNATTGHDHTASSNKAPKIDATTGLKIASQATGDLIYASSASAIARLAIGAANQYLGVSGGVPAWVAFGNSLEFAGATPIIFEGATADAFETSVAVTDPTADRTLTIPNEDVNLGQQVIKAWIDFNGTGTPAINDSFNVTSITDNATGDFTLNWTTAFGNANYSVTFGAQRSTTHGVETVLTGIYSGAGAKAVGSVRTVWKTEGFSALDPVICCVMAIGDR